MAIDLTKLEKKFIDLFANVTQEEFEQWLLTKNKPMTQQTAVDWLERRVEERKNNNPMETAYWHLKEFIKDFEQAKQMEKEQHESTCVEVIERIFDKLEKGENTNSQDVFNKYYNETFGK